MESSATSEMMAQIANIAGQASMSASDEKKRKREPEDKLP